MEQATNEPGAQYPSDDVWRQALNARLHYCSYLHATSNPAERTRLQQSIDGDVESIENVLVTLLKARNNLAHISRLPPELISRIFHYFTSRPDLGLPHRRYRESSEAAPGSPITLSHICHRWRQIVLGDATYWADIPSRVGRRWIEEFIRRSGNLPLRLRIDVPHDFHNTPLDEIRRVVDLSLTGDEAEDTEHLYRRFLNGLTIPAPLLQHFSVDFPVNEASWRAWGYEKRLLLSLPENLFTNNAPALRSVSLYMVDLHWPSSIFGNLEMFEIDWYDRQYSVWTQPDFPTIQQLYDVLTHNPRLRTLKLKRCLPDFATRPAGALAPIHFPHLSDLELLDWAPDCFGVLDLLNVPATCCLKITCTDNHPEYSEDCRELLAWIRNQLERLPSDSGLIVSAALEAYDSRIRIWRCSSDPPPSSQFAFPSEVPLVEIILQYPCMPIDDARFMLTAEQTLHALPITPVVTLSVSTLSMKPTQKEMYRFLLPYSGIKHLQVTVRGGLPERDPKADRISGSFPFLRGQSDPGRRGSSPFLPKLCLLSIGCLEFLLAPPGGAPGEDGVALYDALFWSSRSPQPIETLWVKGCAVSDAEYSALKYLLPDITIHTTELELAIDSQTLWT